MSEPRSFRSLPGRLGLGLALSLLALAACSSDDTNKTQTEAAKAAEKRMQALGMLGPAGAPARLDADGNPAVLAGTWFGYEILTMLNDADRVFAQRNAQHALEYNQTGETRHWKNPATGVWGATTPLRTYLNENQMPCREYQITATVAAIDAKAPQAACRETGGVWWRVK